MTDLEQARELVRESLVVLHPTKGLPDYFRAEVSLREALALLQGCEYRAPLLVLVACDNLAWVCDAQGKEADAETYYLRSLALQQAAGWPPIVCDELTLLKLAQLYARQGRQALHRATLRKMELQEHCSCRRAGPPSDEDAELNRVRSLLKETLKR